MFSCVSHRNNLHDIHGATCTPAFEMTVRASVKGKRCVSNRGKKQKQVVPLETKVVSTAQCGGDGGQLLWLQAQHVTRTAGPCTRHYTAPVGVQAGSGQTGQVSGGVSTARYRMDGGLGRLYPWHAPLLRQLPTPV